MEKLKQILSEETFDDFVKFLNRSTSDSAKSNSKCLKEDLSRSLQLYFQEKTIQDANFNVLSSANIISSFAPEVQMSTIIYLLKVFGDMPNNTEIVLKTLYMNELLKSNTVKRKLVLQSDSYDIPAKVHKNGSAEEALGMKNSCKPECDNSYDFGDCFDPTDINLTQNDMTEPMQIDHPVEKPRSQEKNKFEPRVKMEENFEDDVIENTVCLGPEDEEKFAFLSPHLDWEKKTAVSKSIFSSALNSSQSPTVKNELENNNFQFELSVKLSVPNSPKQFQTSKLSQGCHSNNGTHKANNDRPHNLVSSERYEYSPASTSTSINQPTSSNYCRKSDQVPLIKRQKFFFPVSQPQVNENIQNKTHMSSNQPQYATGFFDTPTTSYVPANNLKRSSSIVSQHSPIKRNAPATCTRTNPYEGLGIQSSRSDSALNPRMMGVTSSHNFCRPTSTSMVTNNGNVQSVIENDSSSAISTTSAIPKLQSTVDFSDVSVSTGQNSENFIGPPADEKNTSLNHIASLKLETENNSRVENDDPSVSEIENQNLSQEKSHVSPCPLDYSSPCSPTSAAKKLDLEHLEEIFSNIRTDVIHRVYKEMGDFERTFNELTSDRFSDPQRLENQSADPQRHQNQSSDKFKPNLDQTTQSKMVVRRSKRVLNQNAPVQPSTEGTTLSTHKTDILELNDETPRYNFREPMNLVSSSSSNVTSNHSVNLNIKNERSEPFVSPDELTAAVPENQEDKNNNEEERNEHPASGSSDETKSNLVAPEDRNQPHSSSSKPAVEQFTKVDERILFAVAEMFPNACPQYLRSLCNGLKYNETSINNVISEILSNENYPKRTKGPTEVVELDLIQQWEMLKEYLPDADPEYLRRKCDEIGKSKELLAEFINNALERRDYPKLKDYLRKQQLCSQIKQYTEDFSVKKFLKIIPNPKEAFKDPKRIVKMDPESMYYVNIFLKNHFSRLPVRAISNAFNKNGHRLLPTFEVLEKELEGLAMKSKRKSVPLTMNLLNIPLLQEIAYIQHKQEIETYIAEKERKRALKRQLAKDNGLLVTCQCCYDEEVMPKDVFNCDNGCTFCRNCLKRSTEITFADAKLDFPCLSNCSGEFSLHTLQEVLEPKLFSKIAQKKALNEVKAAGLEDLEMCPFCDFASIPPEGTKVFQCLNPECMKESCRQCKETSHIPLKCEEVERDDEVKARTYIENKMTDALLRECYKCKLKFYKEEGCNKMTCSCGATMCYVCKQPVTDYKHFNGLGGTNHHLCPLYSDTNSQNARDVLKGAEEAKATIGAKDNPNKLKIDPTADIEKHFQERAKKLPPVHPVVQAHHNHYLQRGQVNQINHLLGRLPPDQRVIPAAQFMQIIQMRNGLDDIQRRLRNFERHPNRHGAAELLQDLRRDFEGMEEQYHQHD